jgi:DNA-binding GntR family transcriptional regulator
MEGTTPRKNGAGHVYAKLKHLLVNYQFKPATQLHPTDLADHFKVSSTPVREALHRLAGEHLLTSVPNKGFYSKVLAFDEMKELSVLSKVLLEHALTTGITPFDAKHFLEYSPNQKTTDSMDKTVPDVEFIENALETIAALSCNRCLSMMIQNLNDRTHYIRLLDLEAEERRDQILQQIKRLVEQVADRNVPSAINNLREQLRLELLYMPKLVKEGLARSCSVAPFDAALSEPIARIA